MHTFPSCLNLIEVNPFSLQCIFHLSVEIFGNGLIPNLILLPPLIVNRLHHVGRIAAKEILIFLALESLRKRHRLYSQCTKYNSITPKWFPKFSELHYIVNSIQGEHLIEKEN